MLNISRWLIFPRLHIIIGISFGVLGCMAINPIMAATKIQGYESYLHERYYVGDDRAFVGDSYDWSGVGLTSISPNDLLPRWATMISSNYFISANHAHPQVGETVRFYETNDPDGAYEEHVVLSGMQIDKTDLWIGRLETSVSDNIGIMPVINLPDLSDYVGQTINIMGWSTTTSSDRMSMRMGRNVVTASTDSYIRWKYDVPGIGADEAKTQSGDSGGGSFIVYNNQPSLVGIHSGANADTSVPAYSSDINFLLCGESLTYSSPDGISTHTNSTWLGLSSNIETGVNWDGGVTPTDDSDSNWIKFNTKGTSSDPTLSRDRSVHGVYFTAGGWNLGGSHTLTVGVGGIDYSDTETGTNTITADILLNEDSGWYVENLTTGKRSTMIISGVISGAGGITKAGSQYGTLKLTGANTYTGQTVLAGDGFTNIIQFTSINNVGEGPSALGAPTTEENGTISFCGAGQLRYTGNGDTTDRDIELTAGGYCALVANGTGALVWNGDVTSTSTADITFSLRGNSSAENQFNGLISNKFASNPNLEVYAPTGGHWIIGNNSNSYTGTTHLAAGTVTISSIANAGEACALGAANNENATIQMGISNYTATLRYIGDGDSTDRSVDLVADGSGSAILEACGTGALIFTSDFQGSGGTSAKILTLSGNSDVDIYNTIAGSISDSNGGATSLLKSGDNTWVLGGANTYAGTTTVEDGVLLVNGSIGTGEVTVSGGMLGGSGVIGGSLLVQNGILAPGNSAGILTLENDVVLTSDACMQIQLFGDDAGTEYDQVLLTDGEIRLGGAMLDILLDGYAPSMGTSFVVIDNQTSSDIDGIFADMPENAIISSGNAAFHITYCGGDGNDVVLTTITPEPSSLMILVTIGFVPICRWRNTRNYNNTVYPRLYRK